MTLIAWNLSTPHFRVIYFPVPADLADQLPRGTGGTLNKHFVFLCFQLRSMQWKKKTEEFPKKSGFPAHLKPIYTLGGDSSFFIEANSFSL